MAGSIVLELRSGMTRKKDMSEAESLYQDMRNGYRSWRTGKRANTKGPDDELRVIDSLRTYSDRYPWEWALEDWDAWNTNLVAERDIGNATQRKYQGYIRTFIRYLERREAFQIRIKVLVGRRIVQFLDDEDMTHHTSCYVRRSLGSATPLRPSFI